MPVCRRTPTSPTALLVTARNDAGESQLTLNVRVNAAARVVALGGQGESSCEVYDPASNSWRAIAPMGGKRSSLAAAALSIG